MNVLERCPICNNPFGDDHQSCRLFDMPGYPGKIVMCYPHQIAVVLHDSLLELLDDPNSHKVLILVKDYVAEDKYHHEMYRFYYAPNEKIDTYPLDEEINIDYLL